MRTGRLLVGAVLLMAVGCAGYGGSMTIGVAEPRGATVFAIPLLEWQRGWGGASNAAIAQAAEGGDFDDYFCGVAPTTCPVQDAAYQLVAVRGGSVGRRRVQSVSPGQEFVVALAQ